MENRTILYRGILKSCNYRCSYCPFSKHRRSGRELIEDKRRWGLFCETLLARADVSGIRAVMVAPYGEALIHPWYWEGLARLSASPSFDAVGAQTNFSFSLNEAAALFEKAGGNMGKLRLWATFHPEMVSAGAFAKACRKAREKGIMLCAGAVGVPEQIGVLQKMREALPDEIYLWINKMDGLKRPYTEQEKEAFQRIDPFFFRELRLSAARPELCQKRLFAEGDGRLRACNISLPVQMRWDQGEDWLSDDSRPAACRQKICSCYLAYGGRGDWVNDILFGPYPLFRIPRRPKAVFLDIDGTLVPKECSEVSPEAKEEIAALAGEGALLFFATTLPYKEAMRRCGSIRRFFHGGIFAAGAHLRLESARTQREVFYPFDGAGLLTFLGQYRKAGHFRILVYRNEGKIYKISLVRSGKRPWEDQEAEELFRTAEEKKLTDRLRFFTEGRCMQIVAAGAHKAGGVRQFCKWLGISLKDTAAAGDSKEDEDMLRLCRGG